MASGPWSAGCSSPASDVLLVYVVAVVATTYGFSIGASALLYQDQRVRREHYDAALRREAGTGR